MGEDVSLSQEEYQKIQRLSRTKARDDSLFSFLSEFKLLPSSVLGKQYNIKGYIGNKKVDLTITDKGENVKLYNSFLTFLINQQNKK